jgi:hypothetical protein
MTVGTLELQRALVVRDNWYYWRWFYAVGHGVIQYIQDFSHLDVDDGTRDPTEWELTITEVGAGGDSTVVVTDEPTGAILITTADQAVDGINMQLGGAAGGTNVDLSGDYPLYFGTSFEINDVDQTAIFAGVGVTDVDWLGGLTDGMYFRSVDETADLYFVTEMDEAENETLVATLADDTRITCEFLYFNYPEVGPQVRVFINGAEVSAARTMATAATFPDDELLRLTVEFTTGEAVANTCIMHQLNMIHIYK